MISAGGQDGGGWSSDAPRKIALGYLPAPVHVLAARAPHRQAIAATKQGPRRPSRPRGHGNFHRFSIGDHVTPTLLPAGAIEALALCDAPLPVRLSLPPLLHVLRGFGSHPLRVCRGVLAQDGGQWVSGPAVCIYFDAGRRHEHRSGLTRSRAFHLDDISKVGIRQVRAALAILAVAHSCLLRHAGRSRVLARPWSRITL